MEWRVREEDQGAWLLLRNKLGISSLVARVLSARGMRDPEEVYRFLNPTLRNLHDPFLMKDMDKGVKRIGEALDSREKILVHGDYDADGITSTALMVKTLEGKSEVITHLPSRYEDGYGISENGIDKAVDEGASLMISVDCGIRGAEMVDHARERGLDVVRTDHHEAGEEIPMAEAVIDPKRAGDDYPFKEIAGVGVAFKISWGLQAEGFVDLDVRDNLDLVALGTVADMVPLVDENRIMVVEGLRQMADTDNKGLRALMREAGIDPFLGISSSDLGFRLGPRINSAGRLGNPDMALELLLTDDRVDADLFARELNSLNFKRKSIGKKLTDEALETIEGLGLSEDPFILVSGEGWHPGVLGIVASSIIRSTGKPTAVLTVEEGEAKGSCRSPPGYDLVKALESCKGILKEFGGHEQAAGVTLSARDIDDLRKRLIDHTLEAYPDRSFRPVQDVDLLCSLSELSLEELNGLKEMSPLGKGNPSPVVYIRDINVGAYPGQVGGGEHLKFFLEDGESSMECIWFGMGHILEDLHGAPAVEVIGHPEVHSWGGNVTPQLRVVDMRIV